MVFDVYSGLIDHDTSQPCLFQGNHGDRGFWFWIMGIQE